METISNIMKVDSKIVTQAQKSFQSSATILKYLDVIAQKLGEIVMSNEKIISITIVEQNVALAVMYSQPVDLKVFGAETNAGSLSLGFQQADNVTEVASAKIPKESFKNMSRIVYSFLFRNDILFRTGRQLNAFETGSLISSKVLAVSVGKEKVENLTSPVSFVFKKNKFQNKSKTFDNVCTFWDPNTR